MSDNDLNLPAGEWSFSCSWCGARCETWNLAETMTFADAHAIGCDGDPAKAVNSGESVEG